MYSFLFKGFYSYLVSKKTDTPIWHASSLVGFSMLMHLFLALKIFDVKLYHLSKGSITENKLFYMPFAALFIVLIYIFFKRRIKKIKIIKVSTFYFLGLILVFIVIPLFFSILFQKKYFSLFAF